MDIFLSVSLYGQRYCVQKVNSVKHTCKKVKEANLELFNPQIKKMNMVTN